MQAGRGFLHLRRGADFHEEDHVIRFVIIAVLVVLAWFAVMSLIDMAKKRKIDWTGVAFMVGFVTLAFWLRSLTGTG